MKNGIKRSKALFLDRDGVVNEDSHYPHKPEHIRFRRGIFSLCRKAIKRGYAVFIVTNQAGIAKGKFLEAVVIALHLWMTEQFKSRGIKISGIYYCPHHPGGSVKRYAVSCDCRKPEPGLIIRAAAEHNLDLEASLMVGDKESDRIRLKGLKSVIIKSEYVPQNYDVSSLKDVEKIL
jgi:D-glycero-D-manno-heptose 1,7-bisphosphate phosphatase